MRLVRTSAAVLTLLSAMNDVAAQGSPRTLVGLWGFEQLLGPEVRGELLLERDGAIWRLRVAGVEVQSRQMGDTVRLSLPGNRGMLRVHVDRASTAMPHVMWVQPAGVSVPYASPVHLTISAPNTWASRVRSADTARPGANQARGRETGLLSGSSNARQAFGDARVKAHDGLRQLIHGRDEGETHGGNDQRVFHQVLSLLFFPEADEKAFHHKK